MDNQSQHLAQRPLRALLIEATLRDRDELRSGLAAHGLHLERTASKVVDTGACDVVLIPHDEFPAMAEALRLASGHDRSLPIVVIAEPNSDNAASHQFAQLGAWDTLTDKSEVNALVARLRNLVSARDEVKRLRQNAIHDESTRLYNLRGMEVRAAELASHCGRIGIPLACVAFSLTSTQSVSTPMQLTNADLAIVSNELMRVGRSSDTIGRIAEHEFALLAPGTGGSEARHLAYRITRNVVAALEQDGRKCDAPWVGRVLQPSRTVGRLGEELLADTRLALQEVTAEYEIPAPV